MKELEAKWIEEMIDYISNNPQFAVRGFGISLILDGINSEEDSDEYTSDDDYGEDNDDGKDINDDEGEETDQEEEASSEDEHSDEEETEGSLYIEDDAELSDSYQCDGNNSHKVSIVVDDED